MNTTSEPPSAEPTSEEPDAGADTGGLLRRALASFWPAPLAAGALWWASFPPLDQFWAAPLGWALLFTSFRLRRGAKAGRQAYVAGLVLFVPGLGWIAPLVSGGWIFTAAWCAGFEALFAWMLARFWLRHESRGGWIVGAALLHLLVDMLRTIALSGFPWLLVGYAGWQNPILMGGAGLLGVHGATVAILLLAGGVAEVAARLLEGRRDVLRPLMPAAVFWGALAAYAGLAAPPVTGRGPSLALLQGAIPQKLKEQVIADGGDWQEYVASYIPDWWAVHQRLIAEALAGDESVDVVVWPETMVPPMRPRPHRDPQRTPEVWKALARMSGGASTLAGVMLFDDLGRKWNSVVLIDPEGAVLGAQDKRHLAPGGEYIPGIEFLPFREALEKALIEKAGFVPGVERGAGPEVLTLRYDGGEARVGVLICYESIFPELAREMVNDGAEFLLNASNYGWFEGTAAMDQTLAMACFRAAELGVPVVMSSNNGHSVVIGADGVPGAALVSKDGRRTDVAGVLVARVPLGGRATPFRIWGEWAAWLLGCLGLVWGIFRGRFRLADPSLPEPRSGRKESAEEQLSSGASG